MHRLERRVQALEQSRPAKPAQIVWNNHDKETEQRVRDLEAQAPRGSSLSVHCGTEARESTFFKYGKTHDSLWHYLGCNGVCGRRDWRACLGRDLGSGLSTASDAVRGILISEVYQRQTRAEL